MSITISGNALPTIHENAQPGDWFSRFRTPLSVLEVQLIGPAAALFVHTHIPSGGWLSLRPAQQFDAEALGDGAILTFGFRVRTADGWQDLAQRHSVTLLGADDTPPQNLRFASGGVVLANDRGAAIGDLIADDPDTPGSLEYTVAWPSSAWFEMRGSTLWLRDGIDLLTQAGTTIEVMIEVSDGLNDAAGVVEVTVITPGSAPAGLIQDGTLFADTLTGTPGDDTLLGYAGPDLLLGEAGQDLLEGGSGDDTLRGDDAADTLRGDEGADTLDGGAGADLLLGGEGDDSLVGGEGHDTLEGGQGADTLDGGAGLNRLLGGLGDDVYLLSTPDTPWIELPGEGFDTLVIGWSATIPGAIEQLRLRALAGGHSLTGSSGADGLFGNEGRNRLLGLGGADTLDGAAGSDTLDGGEGNDLLFGGSEADTLDGSQGDDTLSGGDGADLLRGGDALDQLSGGEGADTLRGGAAADALFGDAGDDRLEGEAGSDLLAGGAGQDMLLGGEGDDRGFGAEGSDTIDGGVGQDSLAGEAAPDLLLGAEGNDVLDGGEGADTLDGGEGMDQLQGGAGNDLLRAGLGSASGLDLLRGGAGADTLDATAADRRGAMLHGGEGDDLYSIDSRLDQVFEAISGGNDTVVATLIGGGFVLPSWVEMLILQGTTVFGLGNAQANRITGNTLANLLFGGEGADTLEGGAGNDTLIGGPGTDLFILGSDGSTDTLVDFNPAEDRILAPGGAAVTDPAGLLVQLLPSQAADALLADAFAWL